MFEQQIENFSRDLMYLRDFVQVVSILLEERGREEFQENFNDVLELMLHLDEIVEDVNLPEDVRSRIEGLVAEKNVDMDNMDLSRFRRIDRAMDILVANHYRRSVLYRNALISLISSVEWFVAQMIHVYYEKYPEAIGGTEKQLSLKELLEFTSIDEAKEYLIEKKVESVLRKGIDEWLNFFKTNMKLSMSYIKECKAHLLEASQRRNILVHNGGVVNRLYLAKYPKSLGVPPRLGTEISITPEYLDSIISIFERCFLLIAAELWKKIDRDNKDRGELLIELAYDHLLKERYDIAESLSLMVYSDTTLSEEDRLYGKINYWLAKKYSGHFEEVKEQVLNEDFTAKSKIFIVAKNALLNEFDELEKGILYLLERGELPIEYVKEWPLFKEFRDSERYGSVLKKYDLKGE